MMTFAANHNDNSDLSGVVGGERHMDQMKDCTQNRDIRNMRNLAEKQRRDKLNGYINDLANTVPLVTVSSKRLDKTSVLRLSAAYLRLNKTALTLRKSKAKKSSSTGQLWRPPKFQFNHLRALIDSVEGFIVVTTGYGKIIYVSHSVENFLGHQNIEMIGHSLTSFLHPNDIELVQTQIQSAHEQVSNGSQTSDKITFQCRLREKNQPRSEVMTYQMVQVSGHITNTKDDEDPDDDKPENKILFKGFVQIIPTNPMAELSLMDADLDEYVSRHSLDGTLLFADHRISNIIGFLPSEVMGNSAYDYILPDDHSIALFAHKLMMSNSNGTGTIVHRLRTASDSFVFLQSSGCLQYDKDGQINHWVCVSRLLIEDEGDKERDKFVKRFTPHIFNISPTALYESLQIVIGPRSGSGSNPPSNDRFSKSSNSTKITELSSNESPPPPPIQQYIQTPSPQSMIGSVSPLASGIATSQLCAPTISGNVNITSKPSNDLSHLLGATVLTFDSQQRPILSVYSPMMANIEHQKKQSPNKPHQQQSQQQLQQQSQQQLQQQSQQQIQQQLQQQQIHLQPQFNTNHVNINLNVNSNCYESSNSATISPTLDTSFYSPNGNPYEEPPTTTATERQILNGFNYEELSNHSTNSLFSFSFPSNDSQCDFSIIEDQTFEERLLDDPFLSSVDGNGDKRIGFTANEMELDPTVEIETPIVNIHNTKTNHSIVFSSKTNTN
ncbi:circadian locomoter output cycles protein kaput-like isoform X2 [Oppia nitens]|uniref:circadian locomoter output cycles protein kaput-like isoform X2 n=1 Tax=Oppia nitens TaxID=1686743 RepID=UPI0023DA69F5|nr:circadian locomoter output cycles protein kaput-like isoform X2 [Oppia nitens]